MATKEEQQVMFDGLRCIKPRARVLIAVPLSEDVSKLGQVVRVTIETETGEILGEDYGVIGYRRWKRRKNKDTGGYEADPEYGVVRGSDEDLGEGGAEK